MHVRDDVGPEICPPLPHAFNTILVKRYPHSPDFNIEGLIFRRSGFTFKNCEVVHKPGPETVTIPSILKSGARRGDPTTVPPQQNSAIPQVVHKPFHVWCVCVVFPQSALVASQSTLQSALNYVGFPQSSLNSILRRALVFSQYD